MLFSEERNSYIIGHPKGTEEKKWDVPYTAGVQITKSLSSPTIASTFHKDFSWATAP